MSDIIKQLIDSGLSRYRIAKLMDVSYNTVIMWEYNMFQPRKVNMDKLEKLLADLKKEAV
jgi:predicted transcriptional regulator